MDLAPNEQILGVYFNKAWNDFSDGFIVTTSGLHLLFHERVRFISYEDIRTFDIHKNKADQGRDLKYRYVELLLKSGENVKVFVSGEYENGCLEMYNLDRFLRYVFADARRARAKELAAADYKEPVSLEGSQV
jgi:hypothetical protein